jgi:tetratricopeptide (TPR) repeat protein
MAAAPTEVAEAAALSLQLLPLASQVAWAFAASAASAPPVPTSGSRVWRVPPGLEPPIHPDALATLTELLCPPPVGGVGGSATRVVVVGPPGVGKTTLVRTACARMRPRFQQAWALDGSSEAALLAGLDGMARDVGLGRLAPDQVTSAVRARLSLPDAAGGWLLVVEGVHGGMAARHLPDLLPNVGGCLVVTARSAAVLTGGDAPAPGRDPDGWAVVALAPLGVDAAAAHLAAITTKTTTITPPATMPTAAWVELLGGLPLALAQAARALTTAASPAAYQAAVADLAGAPRQRYHRDALITAQLAVHTVVQEYPRVSHLCQLLQVVPAAGVPRALLAAAYARRVGLNTAAAAAEPLVAALEAAGLVAIAGAWLAVHPLVQLAMAAVVAPCDEEHLAALVGCLCGQVYEALAASDALLMRQLVALLEAALAWAGGTLPSSPERMHAWVACSLAYDHVLLQPRHGRAALERALALVCPDRDQSAKRLVRAARTYERARETAGNMDQGALDRPRLLLERALLIQERLLGADHIDTATTAAALGSVLGARGNPEAQRQLLERALATQERVHGRDHPLLTFTLVGLGGAYAALGDLQRRADVLERALALQDRMTGSAPSLASGAPGGPPAAAAAARREEQIDLASTLNNLGNTYGALGVPKRQRELLTRALAINELLHGPDHLEVATTLHNLGAAHGALGQPREQLALLERALAIRERRYGPDHLKVAGTLTNMANAHGALGNAAMQRMLLERALALYDGAAALGAGPADTPANDLAPAVIATLFNLGMACRTLRDLAAARAYLQRCLTLARSSHGADHATFKRVQAALARLPADEDMGTSVSPSPRGSLTSLSGAPRVSLGGGGRPSAELDRPSSRSQLLLERPRMSQEQGPTDRRPPARKECGCVAM